MSTKHRLILLLLIAAMILAGCSRYSFHGVPYNPPKPAPAIEGINWDGSDFSLSQLQGKPAVIFFGYTNCPDVCPTTLAEMRALRQALGQQAGRVAFVFVSVDPERDTVARLKEFIPVFDSAFYGVHVNSIDLEAVKQGFEVVAEKVYYNAQDTSAGYSVDHTARTYLVGPAGRLVTSYPYQTDIANIQKDLEFLLKES